MYKVCKITGCVQFDELPTVQHGFMGRLAKELSLRTEQQFDTHIEKLLKILAEGGHILVRYHFLVSFISADCHLDEDRCISALNIKLN